MAKMTVTIGDGEAATFEAYCGYSGGPTSRPQPVNHSASVRVILQVSAILVFGDSTSDPGNNNYILTPFRGNFTPYGRDFANQKATMRCTNGKKHNPNF
ncbi:unnamed protein product [Lactuca saligna]|uniref:Uncharacterized protein n=1 Tax=Lactuca saligna TaxID=75948 RepID=A0AA36EC99_LACSI|nr:unnamed protein product [Lactuca saligna]